MSSPPEPHIKIGDEYFRIDENAEVPFRRVADSLMQPRTDVSGVPGAVNLQRDVWLWQMSDFVGGEGREVFDSSDPVGPPTYFKTDGGVDVRVRGEFSLHPDESLVANTTGGGSAPTQSVWENGASGGDFTTVAGSPSYNVGPNANRVRLPPGASVRAPARTPGTNVVRVTARFIQARTNKQNPAVSVRLQVWNNTDSTSVGATTGTVKENEPMQIQMSFTAVAGKTYHYRASNEEGAGDNTVVLAKITEDSYGTGPAASQDIRALQLGINDNVWGLTWDGTNTDVLRWNFGNNNWDQIVSDMNTGVPRALAGSDQYMYALLDNGRIYRINGSGATYYAEPPTTAGVGEELGLAVANNRLYVLYDQALFELTLDSTDAGLPMAEGETDPNYTIVVSPGEMPKELSPDTTKRQHISALANGVRWFINQRGGQTAIYEFSEGASVARWHLPAGFIATSIHHYANITFIAADFTNEASSPAEARTGIYYIGSDQLLRFLGYLRFTESNSQSVAYMTSYGHDVYFFQGRRIWRYNLGSGGLCLENVTSQYDESKSRALARMDKKFWAAVEGEGTFVADNAYPSQTMWLYSPVWDFDLPDLQKVLLSFDIITHPLPANTQVELEYRMDEALNWTSAGTVTTQDVVKTRFTISSAETNLLTANQSSLETNTAGWDTETNCTIARTTAQSSNGSASLQLTSLAAGAMGARTTHGVFACPIVPGALYTAMASFRAAVSARTCRIFINWVDADGVFISNTDGSITDSTLSWTKATVSGYAPATARYAYVAAYVDSTGAASEVHYVDEIGLQSGSDTTWVIGAGAGTKKFSTIQWRCGLTSLTGADTPRILSVTARAYILDYEDFFDLTILLDDDTSTERLRHQQLTGRQKAQRLWGYKASKKLLSFEDHFSSTLFSDADRYIVVIEDPFQEVVQRGSASLRLKLKVLN